MKTHAHAHTHSHINALLALQPFHEKLGMRNFYISVFVKHSSLLLVLPLPPGNFFQVHVCKWITFLQ